MTAESVQNMEKEALYEYEKTRKECARVDTRINQIADALEVLVTGLRTHPKLVTPTPEVDGPDYRQGLNMLAVRSEVIELCKEIAGLEYKLKNAERRKAALGF